MTTHLHFIIGSYGVMAIALVIELFVLKKHRRNALLALRSEESESFDTP